MSDSRGVHWVMKSERGFDRKPSDRDYATFFKCIMICANGDGELAAAERDWVPGFCEAFGGSPELLAELDNYKATDDIATVLAARTPVDAAADDAGNWARTLVFDSIRACYADGFLSGGERNTINAMANQLGLSAAEVNQLEEHYLAERSLQVKRFNLLFPDKRPHTQSRKH
ncbi:hypothetical protein [Nocardia seriolae]|nr:hypothetical protein [Nocardia seriolae]MTJ64467.1 hypothetical protein [Nocardia seriolae]MTJ73434.1 hypothetical protein [Nocardia seriolae]MTJ87539.1 hypothetical protein [Nocardia seriolae]MTK31530.1 hypothetical protein [Nocardia seriolae]MTK42339.1 hypothetical protein [Nocardia seriolae]